MNGKILVFDIETSHNLQYAFDVWNGVPVNNIKEERNILTASWLWLDNPKEVFGVSVTPTHPRDDRRVLEALSKAISQADAVVAHYGDKFDMPYVRARLAINGMDPIPNVKQIDTCKLAKSLFKFNSNRLDYLGHVLGLGRKKKIPAETWIEIFEGDKPTRTRAIETMLDYNKQDVGLLKDVFDVLVRFKPQLLAWLEALKDKDEFTCNVCGSAELQRRGFAIKQRRKYQRYQCKECGSWHTADKPEAK